MRQNALQYGRCKGRRAKRGYLYTLAANQKLTGLG